MRKPVVMPAVGAASAVVSVWYVRPGERVYAGDRLVEVLVGGATFEVPSPTTGILAEKWAFPDERLTPGQVLGVVEENDTV